MMRVLSDVIHFALVGAGLEQLLEGEGVGGIVDSVAQLAPSAAQLGRTLRIGQARGIKDFAVNAAEDIAEGDFGRGPGQQIAARLAALAFDDLGRFEFDEDLDEVVGGDALGGSHFLDGAGAALVVVLREPEHGAGRIVTFDR